jgi:hypothetical protein
MGFFGDFIGALPGALAQGVVDFGGALLGNSWNDARTRASWAREDSAYQRKVADLRAAGLNPILAASGPGAASSQAIKAEAPRVDVLGPAMEFMRMRSDVSMTEEQKKLIPMQMESLGAQTQNSIMELQNKREDLIAKRLQNQINAQYGFLKAAEELENLRTRTSETAAVRDRALQAIRMAQQQFAYNEKWSGPLAKSQLSSVREQVAASQLRRQIEGRADEWYHKRDFPYGYQQGFIGKTGTDVMGHIFDIINNYVRPFLNQGGKK